MRLHHIGRQSESLGFVRVHENAFAARIIHDIFISDPVGHRDHHLVAWVHQRLREIENHMFAAHADDALGWFVIRAEIFGMTLAHGLLQLERSARARVLGEILLDCAHGGLLDILRRRKIGLAGAEIHYVHARGAQLFRFGRYLHRRRHADQRDAICYFGFEFCWHCFSDTSCSISNAPGCLRRLR